MLLNEAKNHHRYFIEKGWKSHWVITSVSQLANQAHANYELWRFPPINSCVGYHHGRLVRSLMYVSVQVETMSSQHWSYSIQVLMRYKGVFKHVHATMVVFTSWGLFSTTSTPSPFCDCSRLCLAIMYNCPILYYRRKMEIINNGTMAWDFFSL